MEIAPSVEEPKASASEVVPDESKITPSRESPLEAVEGMQEAISKGHASTDRQEELPSVGPGGDASLMPTPEIVPMGVPSLFASSPEDVPGPSGLGRSFANQSGPGVPATVSSPWTFSQV